MTDHDDLSRLLHDAVADVEPTDRIAEIRHRTQEAPMTRKPWLTVALGAAAAVAAVVVGVSVLGDGGEPAPPVASPSETADGTGSASPSASPEPSEPTEPTDSAEPSGPDGSTEPAPAESSSAPTGDAAVPLYFIGDTERAGPRLYREFQRGTPEDLTSVLGLLAGSPTDPDYRTAWRPGQLLEASYDGVETVDVVVDPAVRDRPAGMTEAEARAAVEQVIYTLQAALQERVPVQFRTTENPIDQVYGVPTSEPLAQGSALQVLSHINLTTPEQGAEVRGDSLRVIGLANSFEANVVWEVRRGQETVLGPEPITAEGWMGDRLFVFDADLDVSGLEPGEYTLWVTTDDPSGGEGVGAMTDDKEFTLR